MKWKKLYHKHIPLVHCSHLESLETNTQGCLCSFSNMNDFMEITWDKNDMSKIILTSNYGYKNALA